MFEKSQTLLTGYATVPLLTDNYYVMNTCLQDFNGNFRETGADP
jgi:hypothetical protein